MAELFVSADADADLDEIRDFGDRRFGEAVSSEYVSGLFEVFDLIVCHPDRGCLHLGYTKTQLRSVTYRKHRVFYDVTPHAVRIVRILHQAMDFDQHIN